MQNHRLIRLGLQVTVNEREELIPYFTNKGNFYPRIFFALRDYLTYTKKFESIITYVTDKPNILHSNGTITGIMGDVNRSLIDIGIRPSAMNEKSMEIVGFSYPFKLYYRTFLIRKPEYQPHLFGILQTFTPSIWVAIVSSLIAMALFYHGTLKKRHSFDKICLHVFAVLLRQSAILTPTSMLEKSFIYLWVVAAMFICLAYDSVFLSFLAFPPVTAIRGLSELARAVEKGDYHCIAPPGTAIYIELTLSKEKKLSILGRDLKTNNISYKEAFEDLQMGRAGKNLAYIVDAGSIDSYAIRNTFISEDRFLDVIAAMIIRKDFCCKRLIEKFVHRFMATGLYCKFENDKIFLARLPLLLKFSEDDPQERKLTLTDVAPAFIFLLTVYVISFLVLIGEILLNRRKS